MTEHEKLVLTKTSKGFDVLTGKNLLLNNQTIKRYLRITQGLSQNNKKLLVTYGVIQLFIQHGP